MLTFLTIVRSVNNGALDSVIGGTLAQNPAFLNLLTFWTIV